jgi:hypothetical protein
VLLSTETKSSAGQHSLQGQAPWACALLGQQLYFKRTICCCNQQSKVTYVEPAGHMPRCLQRVAPFFSSDGNSSSISSTSWYILIQQRGAKLGNGGNRTEFGNNKAKACPAHRATTLVHKSWLEAVCAARGLANLKVTAILGYPCCTGRCWMRPFRRAYSSGVRVQQVLCWVTRLARPLRS